MVTITGGNRTIILSVKGIEGRRFFSYRTTVGTTTVFDIKDKNITVETLSMSCNHLTNCILKIRPYKADATLDDVVGIILYDGSGADVGDITPNNLHIHFSSFLTELVYSAVGNDFKMAFKRPIKFPNGAKIEIIVVNADQKINCLVLVSVEGE